MKSKKPTKEKVDKVDKALKFTHEVFCQNYAGMSDRSMMANATLSYIDAFKIDTPTTKVRYKALPKSVKHPSGVPSYWDYTAEYKSARSAASRLITSVNIRVRIHQLFKILFSNDIVDNELLKVIMQDVDPKAKVMGIKEFNELKGRITKKIKLSGGVKSNLNDNQMTLIAEQVLKKSKAKK